MKTVNIHEAKTHLSRLLVEVAGGESFIIAKAGKPIAQVTRIEDVVPKPTRRLGMLEGLFKVPDDFDTMMEGDMEAMFYGE